MQQTFYSEKVSNTSAESLCADGDSQSEHCPCDLQKTDHESPAFRRSAFRGLLRNPNAAMKVTPRDSVWVNSIRSDYRRPPVSNRISVS